MRHRSSGSRARGTRLSPPADGAHSAQQLWRASVSARVTAFSSPHDTAWTDRPPQSSTCGDVYSRPESVFSRQARAGIDTEQDSTLLRLPRVPGAPGVPDAVADLTLTVPFNDLEQLSQLMDEVGDDVAAIIIEPIAGNMNMIEPLPGYLEGLRKLCDQHGSVLIFDEVMTGFRVARGGAQELYGVKPDLTTFGKVIGGGLPVGAFGGRRDIMEYIAPTGPVYQAGTLSGNPLAMAAGSAMMKLISAEGFYDHLSTQTKRLTTGLQDIADEAGVPFNTCCQGGMFGLFFTDQPVHRFADLSHCDEAHFKRFFHAMLKAGVYLAPSAYEAGFVSAKHSDEIIDQTLTAAQEAIKA